MGYYSAIKRRKGVLPFGTIWIDLEDIVGAYPVAQWLRTCLTCRRCSRRRFDPWVGNVPWRRIWQSTPVFSPGGPRGQRSLVGYSPWGHKKSDTGQVNTQRILS